MSATDHQNLELLIYGFLKIECIPNDIIIVISKYFTYYWINSSSYLLLIESNMNVKHILKTFNISNKIKINKHIDIKFVSRFAKISQWNKQYQGDYIINKIKSPIYIKQIIQINLINNKYHQQIGQ